jgi:hypothetical protein
MNVDVKIGGLYESCTIARKGVCKYCNELIVWAARPNGKFIPLQPEEAKPGVMESHFSNCTKRDHARQWTRGQLREPRSQAGIEMTETVWRQLVRLVHPDKHHGGDDERLANDLTRWLLEQRPRLKREGRL